MIFVARGTTELSLRGSVFSTSRLNNFLEHVYKIDKQDFLTKMEGFAIQGLVGG
jgi:hypothetical protein